MSPFWSIIERVNLHASNKQEYLLALHEELITLSPQELVSYQLELRKHYTNLYTTKLWYTAVVIMDSCSDDGFIDFRCWVISKGKEIYEEVSANPDALHKYLVNKIDYSYSFEDFMYAASGAYFELAEKDIYLDPAFNGQTMSFKDIPDIDFSLDHHSEDVASTICPTVYAMVSENVRAFRKEYFEKMQKPDFSEDGKLDRELYSKLVDKYSVSDHLTMKW